MNSVSSSVEHDAPWMGFRLPILPRLLTTWCTQQSVDLHCVCWLENLSGAYNTRKVQGHVKVWCQSLIEDQINTGKAFPPTTYVHLALVATRDLCIGRPVELSKISAPGKKRVKRTRSKKRCVQIWLNYFTGPVLPTFMQYSITSYSSRSPRTPKRGVVNR